METIIRRERLIIGGCLAAPVLVAWSYLLSLEGGDARYGHARHGHARAPRMGRNGVLLLFMMWAVMMVAMMVPSAAPMILAFLTMNHRRQTNARPLVPAGIILP